MKVNRWPCPFDFKGPMCSYKGSGKICDKTFEDCIKYKNEENFGGYIMPDPGIDLASGFSKLADAINHLADGIEEFNRIFQKEVKKK